MEGSTHNFIQTRVAKYLQLPLNSTPPLQVTMGNSTTLPCDQLCPNTALHLQGQFFYVNFHVFPISRADIVLDVQWLRQLGPILTNYETLTMQFRYNDNFFILQADASTLLEDSLSLQFWRMIQTHYASAFFHISISPHTPHTSPASFLHPIPAITNLLHKYSYLFSYTHYTASSPNHHPPNPSPSKHWTRQCPTISLPSFLES